MNEELKDIFFYALTIKDVIGRLIISLVCGLIIAGFYRITYKGLSYSSSFVNAIILLTMITTVVIMVIGNNLAAAFGLVGAMSIIRFRTAVKDIQDIMFIFFALAIGLACGVDFTSVAIIGTLIIGAVYWVIVHFNWAAPRRRDFLLQLITVGKEDDNNLLNSVLSKYCSRYKVVNVKAVGEESNDMLEVSYYIKMKNEDNGQKFIREVKEVNNIRHANLFFDEE
ncbi:MAG: DUF4956 domain-containing protein [Cytophagaceae bacterium]